MRTVWMRMLCGAGASAVALGALAATGAVGPAVARVEHVPAGQRLAAIASRYSTEPVDARVDRVWHAIPGLAGWQLDVAASAKASEQANDGKLHLVWRPVPPAVRLAQLPAEPVYRGPKEERSVSLMFNVSWGEAYIQPILRTLADKRVKATFFLDGAWVRKHPDLARAIALAGHDIGSHGSGHPDFRRLTDAQLARQISGTNAEILHTVGNKVTLLAPPAGSYDQRTVRLAKAAGMYTILWTTDTIDWRRPPARVIVERAVNGAEPGALILMHPTEPTAQALPLVIDGLRRRGFDIKTVAQVIAEQRTQQPPAVLSQ